MEGPIGHPVLYDAVCGYMHAARLFEPARASRASVRMHTIATMHPAGPTTLGPLVGVELSSSSTSNQLHSGHAAGGRGRETQ